jgi:hypothetical protein
MRIRLFHILFACLKHLLHLCGFLDSKAVPASTHVSLSLSLSLSPLFPLLHSLPSSFSLPYPHLPPPSSTHHPPARPISQLRVGPATAVRRLNMYAPAGDVTHFGQAIEPFNVPRMWSDVMVRADVRCRKVCGCEFWMGLGMRRANQYQPLHDHQSGNISMQSPPVNDSSHVSADIFLGLQEKM